MSQHRAKSGRWWRVGASQAPAEADRPDGDAAAAESAGPLAAPVTAGRAASPTLTVDALGKKCPIPIIMLADRIRDVPVGQTIEVLADDPAARTDLPAWCTLKSQEFVAARTLAAGWSFLVRRSY